MELYNSINMLIRFEKDFSRKKKEKFFDKMRFKKNQELDLARYKYDKKNRKIGNCKIFIYQINSENFSSKKHYTENCIKIKNMSYPKLFNQSLISYVYIKFWNIYNLVSFDDR